MTDTLFDTTPPPTTEPDTIVDTTTTDNLGCSCPTPWDPTQPVTLYVSTGAGKNTTTKHTIEFATTGRPRPLAEAWLTRNSYTHTTWEYRTGKTPHWQTTLTNGWTARVTDPNGKHTTGYHCPNCHRHFKNEMAADLHRAPTHTATVNGQTIDLPGPTNWLAPCLDPADIRHIGTGVPLLYPSGEWDVWTLNYGAVWPNGVQPPPPMSNYTWLPWDSTLKGKALDRVNTGQAKRPLCKVCSEPLDAGLAARGVRRHVLCSPRPLWTQEDYDVRPLADLPRRQCPRCHRAMVVYEVGQKYHPGCDPTTPRSY